MASLSWSWGPPSSWEYGRMHPYLEEAVRASHLPYLLGCLTSLADSLPRTEAWEAGDSRLLLSPNYATCPGKGLPTEGLHTCGTRTQQVPHGYAWAWGPSASLRVPQGTCSGYSRRGPPRENLEPPFEWDDSFTQGQGQ